MGSNMEHLRDAQYGTARNFNARVALHQRFRTNPYGFNRWLFDRLLRLPDDSRLLELGCGPGWLWRANVARIPRRWVATLTDCSRGMATEARSHLVRSLSRPLGETAADTAERIARLHAFVAAEIAARGTIQITTDTGLLTAIRP
jgi:hypothetical protein